jgi:hypothetical protein
LGLLPLAALALAHALRTWAPSLLHADLRDGLVVMACVPTTSNMCVVLTSAAQGDAPAAVLNAVGGNLLGVLVTPLLLRVLLGLCGSATSAATGSRSSSAPALGALVRRLGVKVWAFDRTEPANSHAQPLQAHRLIFEHLVTVFRFAGFVRGGPAGRGAHRGGRAAQPAAGRGSRAGRARVPAAQAHGARLRKLATSGGLLHVLRHVCPRGKR